MLTLPDVISAQLVDAGSKTPLGPDILVSAAFRANGRYYYGDLMGLTNENGVVRLTREEVERHFAENRKLFLMDYKIPLAECDPEVEILVRGGPSFLDLKAEVDDNELVDAHVRAAYQRARNAEYETSTTRVGLPDLPEGDIRVVLPVSPRRA